MFEGIRRWLSGSAPMSAELVLLESALTEAGFEAVRVGDRIEARRGSLLVLAGERLEIHCESFSRSEVGFAPRVWTAAAAGAPVSLDQTSLEQDLASLVEHASIYEDLLRRHEPRAVFEHLRGWNRWYNRVQMGAWDPSDRTLRPEPLPEEG